MTVTSKLPKIGSLQPLGCTAWVLQTQVCKSSFSGWTKCALLIQMGFSVKGTSRNIGSGSRARALALSLSLSHSLSRVQASQIERQSVFLVQLTHRAGRLHLAADESASRRNRAAVAAPASWRPDRKAQTGRARPPGIAKANSVRQEQCGRQMCSGNPTSRHVRKQLFRHVLSLRQAEFTLLDAEAVALAGEDNLGRCRRYRHNIAWRAARCCGWPHARAAGRGRSRSATCAPIAATTGSSARLRAHAPARRARMPAHASQSLWPDTPQHH